VTSDPLLQPFTLKTLELRNRVFSSSHEPAYSEEGMPKARYRLYHVEKAKGGVALTMTAGTAIVSPDSPPAFGNLHAYDDAIVPWIRAMTDDIHEHGAAAMIQISHLGRRTGWDHDDWLPVVAPSPLREPAHRSHPKVAEHWDIDRIVGEYADAAERMKVGGMDGIEIEAYGHLFDQFWSPATNHRTDEYGGSLANRLRYPLEVFRAVREVWPKQLPISVRISAHDWVEGGITPDDAVEIARVFKAAGADMIDCSSGQVSKKQQPVYGRMYQTPFADRIRNEVGIPTIAVGAISEADHVNSIIAAGRADLCAVARPHLANPAWTLLEAAKIGVTDVPWPKQYRSAKVQLERNLEREKSMAAQAGGASPLEQANRALGV